MEDINRYNPRNGRLICDNNDIVNEGDAIAADVPHTIAIAAGATAMLVKMGGVTLITPETLTDGEHVFMDDVISTSGTVTGAVALGGGLYRVGRTDVGVTA